MEIWQLYVPNMSKYIGQCHWVSSYTGHNSARDPGNDSSRDPGTPVIRILLANNRQRTTVVSAVLSRSQSIIVYTESRSKQWQTPRQQTLIRLFFKHHGFVSSRYCSLSSSLSLSLNSDNLPSYLIRKSPLFSNTENLLIPKILGIPNLLGSLL